MSVDRRQGYGTGTAGDTGFTDQTRDPNWSPTGLGNQVVDGGMVGDNAYDTSVAQDRADAVKMHGSQSVQLDQRQANQSRGLQMNALGMLRAQADGSAPSAAAIQSQRANEAAAANIARAGVAGHGIGARLAAQGGAMPGAVNTALAANAANAGNRAQEISTGQNAYAGGAGTVNQQDIGAATTQAQLDAQQRSIAQQNEEYYDQLAFNTRRQQAANQIASRTQTDQAINADRNYRDAKDQQGVDAMNTGVSTVLSAFSGGAGGSAYNAATGAAKGANDPSAPPTTPSDPRTKMNIGSLSGLRRGR